MFEKDFGSLPVLMKCSWPPGRHLRMPAVLRSYLLSQLTTSAASKQASVLLTTGPFLLRFHESGDPALHSMLEHD